VIADSGTAVVAGTRSGDASFRNREQESPSPPDICIREQPAPKFVNSDIGIRKQSALEFVNNNQAPELGRGAYRGLATRSHPVCSFLIATGRIRKWAKTGRKRTWSALPKCRRRRITGYKRRLQKARPVLLRENLFHVFLNRR
jgi:hypothetical protein